MAAGISKAIAITRAGSGIGEAAARLLAAQGHQVRLGARREDRLLSLTQQITTAGGTADCKALDVTRRQSMQAFVDATLARYGRLDVIINNAGRMPLSKLEALKVDEWDRMSDVNIRGVLYGIAAALPIRRNFGAGESCNMATVKPCRSAPGRTWATSEYGPAC